MIAKILPLIVAFLAVYGLKRILKRIGVLKKEYEDSISKLISKLVLWIVAPVVIAKSLAQATVTLNLLYLPVIAILAVSSLLLIGYALSYVLKLKGKTRGSFIIAFPTLEGGTVGYAFMLAAFGELGLSRIVLFDFGNALFEFSAIYFIAVMLGKNAEEKTTVVQQLIKLLKTPVVLAIPAGLLLNVAHVQIPALYGIVDVMGIVLTFLVMAFLGLEFEPRASSFKLPVITLALQSASSVIVGFGLAWLFGLQGMERAAVIIGTCLPTSIFGLLFAKENGLDTKFMADLLALGLPFSFVFLTVLLKFI